MPPVETNCSSWTEPALAATLRAAAQEIEPPCAMVVDCLAMDDYDPDARRAFVEWHKAHKGRVSAVAILTTGYSVGQILGPLLVAPLLEQGYQRALLVGAGFVLASLLAALALRIRYPQPAAV